MIIENNSDYFCRIFDRFDLSSKTISNCAFESCIFQNAIFLETVFSNCSFTNCIFTDCDLSDTYFVQSKICGIYLHQQY
ncbi:pentapeptide repeat-containing protein [Cellvibrio sp.]|uniref:pentapeptide repeat-containing protein n=1 Tax=Cellvibrio sp. TaxID=1965322 RepID=UPI003F4C7728